MTSINSYISITNLGDFNAFLASGDLHLVSELSIYNVPVSNVDFLRKCINLKKLSILKMSISNLDVLKDLSIESLCLYDLPKLPGINILPSSITKITLGNVSFDNLDFLRDATQIIGLKIDNVHVNDMPIINGSFLKYLPNLQHLNISNMLITNPYLNEKLISLELVNSLDSNLELKRCTNLEELLVSNSPNSFTLVVSSEKLKAFCVMNLPNCEYICVTSKKLTDMSCEQALKLTELYLGGKRFNSTGDISHIDQLKSYI